MGMWTKKLAKLVVSSLLGLVFAFSLIEGGLRFARALRSTDAVTAPSDGVPNVVRIVTLGESTTAKYGFGGRTFDWPQQLEDLLNRWLEGEGSPKRVKVFNLARSATSSPFQVSSLFERESEIKPDVLITMLGVNDANVVEVERDFFYRNFLTVRLIYWGRVAYLCPSCRDVRLSMTEPIEPPGVGEIDRDAERMALRELEIRQFRSVADVDKFAADTADWQQKFGDHQHWMNAKLAAKLFSISQSESLRQKSSDVAEKLLDLTLALLNRSYRQMVLLDPWTLEYLCHVHNLRRQPGCLTAVKEAFAGGMRLTAPLLTLAAHSGGEEDPDMRKIFESAGYAFVTAAASSHALHQSFMRLQKFVASTHTIWFAMQYPTGSVEALKYYMNDDPNETDEIFGKTFYMTKAPFEPKFKDVTYVSNENFNQLVRAGKATDYFVDMFARVGGMEFGHTTEKGHAVIARNVADAIRLAWPRIVERSEQREQEDAK
jgi:hypothetical protein